MSKENVQYQLNDPLEYSFKGNIETALFIELSAPSAAALTFCADLKQNFMMAAMHASSAAKPRDEAPKEDDDQSIEPDDIVNMLNSCPEVSYSQCLLLLKALFLSKGKNPVAMIDGEQKFTSPLWDDLSMDDVEGLLGVYLANFILASVIKKLSEE